MAESLIDLLTSFQRELAALGRSDKTTRVYTQSVVYFTAWLKREGRPLTIESLTKATITEWLASLTDKAPKTRQTYFRGLRRFVRWVHLEGEIDTDPMFKLPTPQAAPAPVAILTDDQISALLAACNGKTFELRRDEALVRLMLDSGARVSEVAAIRLDDLDLNAQRVRIHGKGGRIRLVGINHKAIRALDRYVRIRRRHKHAASPQLWLGQRGPLSTDGVGWVLECIAVRAGIPGVHPHQLRHTFAHRWLAAGGGERDLMTLAGWSSDTMLSTYASSTASVRALAAHKRLALGDEL